MADIMTVCVEPSRVPEVWPHFKHWLEAACEKIGLITIKYLENEVMAGRNLLWLAYDGETVHAAAVTELGDGFCTIVACGGKNLKIFLPCMESLEAFARDEKCKGVRVVGRKGWARVLKNYKTKAIFLERQF